MYTANNLVTVIRDQAQNELEELGTTSSTQNDAIFRFLNIVLRRRAKQAYIVETSDVLNITSDGYQSFQKSGVSISDMFEPLHLYDAAGYAIRLRMSLDSPKGWFREDAYKGIHTKGITGNVTLKYLRYPRSISLGTDSVEFPESGLWDLIYDTVSMIKFTKGYYSEADNARQVSSGIGGVKGSIVARGTANKGPTLKDTEV